MKTRIGKITAIITVMLLLIGNIQAYGLESVKLKEIRDQGEEKQAVLITPEGEEVTVEEGDRLPKDYGRVFEIKARSVMIKQPAPDGEGNIYYQLIIPSDAGPMSIRIY